MEEVSDKKNYHQFLGRNWWCWSCLWWPFYTYDSSVGTFRQLRSVRNFQWTSIVQPEVSEHELRKVSCRYNVLSEHPTFTEDINLSLDIHLNQYRNDKIEKLTVLFVIMNGLICEYELQLRRVSMNARLLLQPSKLVCMVWHRLAKWSCLR